MQKPSLLKRAAALLTAVCTVICIALSPGSPSAFAASDINQAALELREHLKAHDPDFTISFDRPVVWTNAGLDQLVSLALAETNSGEDGDYIRWGMGDFYIEPVYGNVSYPVGLRFVPAYKTTSAQEAELTDRLAELEKELHLNGKNQFERIEIIYSYITSHVTYSPKERFGDDIVYTAYSALIEGNAVCQGYAQLMYRMLKDCGIECRLVPGTADNGDHAWNIAAIDGTYYLLDPTWDSNLAPDSKLFFLRGTNDFDLFAYPGAHTYNNWGNLDATLYSDFTAGSDFFTRYPVAASSYDQSLGTVSLPGDINGDSLIDSTDATIILASYSEASTAGDAGLTQRQKKSGDADGNGMVDSTDASVILKYYSSLSTGGSMTLEQFRVTNQ